jgi:hypothetical protein
MTNDEARTHDNRNHNSLVKYKTQIYQFLASHAIFDKKSHKAINRIQKFSIRHVFGHVFRRIEASLIRLILRPEL